MACERYQRWITDAALGNLSSEQEQEWRFHVSACAGCREALAKQQFLLAAIERGLEARLASEPSPAFLARVRTNLAEICNARQARYWRRLWNFAAAACAVIALTIWIAHRPGIPQQPAGRTQQNEAASSSAPGGHQVASAGAGPTRQSGAPASLRPRTVVRERSSKQDVGPKVIVPAGDEAGLAHLYYALQRPGVLTSGPVVASDEALELLSISPIEIPPLKESGLEGTHAPDVDGSR